MSEAQIRNAALYVAYALAGALVATGLQFAAALNAPGPVEWRPLAATFTTSLFGALATALGASRLTRLGSEPIAEQVNELRERGVPRSQMAVVPMTDRPAPRLSDEDVDRLARRGLELMRERREAETPGPLDEPAFRRRMREMSERGAP
jgi:hypothetical protein